MEDLSCRFRRVRAGGAGKEMLRSNRDTAVRGRTEWDCGWDALGSVLMSMPRWDLRMFGPDGPRYDGA